jgi:flagellar hook-associated protein 1 FlgK
VAAAIAAAYREDAPTSRITGRALTALPADGLGTSVFLGDQRYDLLVDGGEISVTGPEDGRVSAYFDTSNQLVVETVGGSVNGDALRLGDVPRNAVAFGVDSVTRDLIGTAVDFDTLPAGANSFDMVVDGTTHSITVTRAGGNVTPSVPAGFPGAVAYDAGTQQITFTLNDPTVSVDIPPSEIATSAGFQTAGATLSVVEGELILQSTDGRVLDTDITASSLADNRITLTGLPDEDLLVFMSDTGALGLAGAVDIPADPPLNGPVELRVLDGARGLVEMVDIASGASIATRVLDDTGSATLGGFSVTLSGQLNTGDRFTISPNTDGTGDARNLETIGDMRLSDPDEGVGGFAVLYNRLLTDVAAKVTGAETREETATALKQGADRDVAKGAAVDLDVEAANLMTQQQAYQANAQVIQVARQLFDTLINSL